MKKDCFIFCQSRGIFGTPSGTMYIKWQADRPKPEIPLSFDLSAFVSLDSFLINLACDTALIPREGPSREECMDRFSALTD